MNKIFGIGTDIVSNARIAGILSSPIKQRFLNKVLHPKEIEEFNTKDPQNQQAEYLASRWAMKEAVVKACGKREIIFSCMYLQRFEGSQKPQLTVEGSAEKILKEQLGIKEFHVSISHEKEFSVAFVLLTI